MDSSTNDINEKQVLISNYPLNISMDNIIQSISNKFTEKLNAETHLRKGTAINNSEFSLSVPQEELENVLNLNGSYIYNNPIWIIHFPNLYLNLIPCLSQIFSTFTIDGIVDLSTLSNKFSANDFEATLIDFNNLDFVEFLIYRLGTESRDKRFFVESLVLDNNDIKDTSEWYRFQTFLPNLHKLILKGNPITKSLNLSKWPYLGIIKDKEIPPKKSKEKPKEKSKLKPEPIPQPIDISSLKNQGKIWALSDFHLPGVKGKSMSQFGEIWVNHTETIKENVTKLLTPNDILLVPGDISWASKIDETKPDFEFIGSLPCTVIISEGNHDRWASKYNAIMSALPENTFWCQRECYRKGNVAIVATRLWEINEVYPWPGEIACSCDNPQKMQESSIKRLIEALEKLPQDEGIIRILMVHFPPLAFDASSGAITNIIDKYNVNFCVYGHVHALEEKVPAVNAIVNHTHYFLTSCDWLQMVPLEITNYKY